MYIFVRLFIWSLYYNFYVMNLIYGWYIAKCHMYFTCHLLHDSYSQEKLASVPALTNNKYYSIFFSSNNLFFIPSIQYFYFLVNQII